MAIKKLQNNYTTPEQSKQLLELGVPVNSADCIFTRFSRDEKWKRRFIEDVVSAQLFCNQDYYLPCWSVGRLIEIWEIITGEKWLHETEQPIIEELISNFNYYSYDNDDPLDFSKLNK